MRGMILSLAAILAAAAAATSAAAQPSPIDLESARIRAHVAFLADDLLEGRETGTRGHEIAAAYVAQQLAALGFVGAGANGSFFQHVPFLRSSPAGAPATLTLDLPAGQRVFTHGEEISVLPSLSEETDTISAPIAFAGFGLTAPAMGHDDYAGLDVRGKIVVVFSGAPRNWPGDVAAHLNGEKRRMAEAAGAIGIITLRNLADERIYPWAQARTTVDRPRLNWLFTDQRPFVEAPGVTVAVTATDPAGRALFEGAARSFEALKADADAGRPMRGFPLAGRATIRRAASFTRLESPNVVALLPGADPSLRDEVVLLMGHLDHLGLKADGDGDRVYNGAMDNAMGIAIMLETARAVAQGPRPGRSILVLATTAEEKGLLGAEYFAQYPVVPRDRIVAAINMDMPVLTFALRNAVGFGAEHSTLGPVAEAATRAESLQMVPDPEPEQRFFTRSDHYPLVKAGVPAIYVDTATHDAASAAANRAFDAHYHEVSDDISQPIHWESAARLARINTTIAREVANADQRPRWRAGSFFADTFAAGQPRAPASPAAQRRQAR